MKYSTTYSYYGNLHNAAFVRLSANKTDRFLTEGALYSYRHIDNLKRTRFLRRIFINEYGYENTCKIWNEV